jgi:hypothetical protein
VAERDLTVRIDGNSAGLTAATTQATASMNGMGDGKSTGPTGKLSGAFVAMGAAAAAAGALMAVEFAKMSWTAATEASDARANVERTFGTGLASKFISQGKSAAEALGIPAREYEKSVAMLGQSLQGLGYTTEDSAAQMDPLISRLADVAARAGTDLPSALEAFGSLLRGERDPIEKYGVAIKQSDVNARLAAQGLSGLEGEALKNAEAQASLQLFMEATTTSTGAFAERSETAAGKLDVMGAKFEDIKASFGSLLQSGFVAAWDYLVDEVWPQVDEFLSEHKDELAAIGDAIGKIWEAWQGLWTYIGPIMEKLLPVWLWTMQLLVGFLGIVAENVSNTMDAFSQLYGYIKDGVSTVWGWFQLVWGWISDKVTGVADTIREHWDRALNGIKAAVAIVGNFISAALSAPVNAFKSLWNSTIGGKGMSVPDWIPGIGGKEWKIPRLAAGGIVTSPTLALIGEAGPEAVVPLGAGGGLGTTNITINIAAGVGDPVEIGREVARVLKAYENIAGPQYAKVA